MKKLIVILAIIISINIVGCSQSVSEKETFDIKKNQELKIGEDIPEGSYILKSDKDGLALQIIKKDGSTSSLFIVNNEGDDYIEYEIKLIKNTSIKVTEDSIITQK